jgi:ABC-type transport system involved in cytochrome bd biosynthesis fused ATPase/permease subunit
LIINNKTHVRGAERRRKRTITPIIYFFVETIFVWLVLGLIQINFNMFTWSFWAITMFIIAVIYSIIKTVNVYQRQKDYIESNEKVN